MMRMFVHADLQDGRSELIKVGACKSFQYLYIIVSIITGCTVMGVLRLK
jgi:hypothetical protein